MAVSFDAVGVIVAVGAYFAGSFPTATIAGITAMLIHLQLP